MVVARSRLAVVVLAAGPGSRFSDEPGGKLLAPLEGRPLLEHVLGAVRAFAPRRTIVVIGHGAEAIERSIDWAGEERVRNPRPGRGIGSSIRVGFDAIHDLSATLEGVFIVLGDQPGLRTEVLEALAEAADPHARRAVVATRYADHPGPRNPVLLMRRAWPIVDELLGDEGLGALLDARPDLVRDVPVPGAMPDVDRPEDLGALREP